MSKLGIIFAFSLGAAAGTAVSWKVLKAKYERYAQEEIDQVKEVYKKKYESENTNEGEPDPAVETYETSVDAAKMVTAYGYSTFSENTETPVVKEEKKEGPYVISPEEFDEIGYEVSSLTYYADGVLADDVDDVIENVDALVGEDSLKAFGEYEDDSVFVRNDALKTDFEILLDKRKYSEVVGPSVTEK